MKKFDVVILAGGKGTRIKKLLKNNPKPLSKISHLYFLEYLINNISKFYINKIFIIAGYKGKKISKVFNNVEKNLIPIEVIVEKEPLGTAGALSLIKNRVTNNFIVLNGDSIFDVNLNEIANVKLKKHQSFMALTNNSNYKSNKTLSNIKLKKNLVVKSISSRIMNAGIYKFNKELIKNIKPKFQSLENEILLQKIEKKEVIGKYFNNFFLDIGTPKNLRSSKKLIPKYFRKPAIFLDRDGTLNYDKGYTYRIQDFKFIKGTLKTLKKLSKKKYYLFIVTNQAGIAKNKFKKKDFYALHNFLKKIFLKHNININDIKFCPFHPNAKILKYRKNSGYRKPGNLMLEDLKKKWDIDLSKSYMIGDKKIDYIAAKKSNIKFLYLNKNLSKTLKKLI